MLSARLERLSADSRYAHKASGIRGQILRYIAHQGEETLFDIEGLREALETGFEIIRQAAEEIPDTSDQLGSWHQS